MEKRNNKDKEAQPLKNVIHQFINHYRLQGRYNEAKVKAAWEKLMGTFVLNRTERIFLKEEGTLVIELNSPALRQEVMFSKADIIKQLNDYIGAEVIREVVIL